MKLLNHFALEYQPNYIFYFYFDNDLRDLNKLLNDQRMKQFIETPLSELTFQAPTNTKHPLINQFMELGLTLFDESLLVADALRLLKNNFLIKLSELDIAKEYNQRRPKDKFGFDQDSLEWKYMRKSIEQMNDVSKLSSIKFIIVRIPVTLSRNNQEATLIDFAKTRSIPLINPKSMEDVSEYYLPRMGHFNALGAEKMAEILNQFIQSQ